jgi:hypothetical protein
MIDLLHSNCGILKTDTPESIIEKVRSGLERVGMDPDQDQEVGALVTLGLSLIL